MDEDLKRGKISDGIGWNADVGFFWLVLKLSKELFLGSRWKVCIVELFKLKGVRKLGGILKQPRESLVWSRIKLGFCSRHRSARRLMGAAMVCCKCITV